MYTAYLSASQKGINQAEEMSTAQLPFRRQIPEA
jgi:hypothetical protein